jgi:hypothetical protein
MGHGTIMAGIRGPHMGESQQGGCFYKTGMDMPAVLPAWPDRKPGYAARTSNLVSTEGEYV